MRYSRGGNLNNFFGAKFIKDTFIIKNMKNTWKGWIIDESLKDATILSKLKVLKEKVEENTEGDTKNVWKLYAVEVDDKEINEISNILEKQIKLGYYAHFTNEKKLLIIFHKKSFLVRLESIGEDKGYGITSFEAKPGNLTIWKSAFDYGIKEGEVDSRYIITVK